MSANTTPKKSKGVKFGHTSSHKQTPFTSPSKGALKNAGDAIVKLDLNYDEDGSIMEPSHAEAVAILTSKDSSNRTKGELDEAMRVLRETGNKNDEELLQKIERVRRKKSRSPSSNTLALEKHKKPTELAFEFRSSKSAERNRVEDEAYLIQLERVKHKIKKKRSSNIGPSSSVAVDIDEWSPENLGFKKQSTIQKKEEANKLTMGQRFRNNWQNFKSKFKRQPKVRVQTPTVELDDYEKEVAKDREKLTSRPVIDFFNECFDTGILGKCARGLPILSIVLSAIVIANSNWWLHSSSIVNKKVGFFRICIEGTIPNCADLECSLDECAFWTGVPDTCNINLTPSTGPNQPSLEVELEPDLCRRLNTVRAFMILTTVFILCGGGLAQSYPFMSSLSFLMQAVCGIITAVLWADDGATVAQAARVPTIVNPNELTDTYPMNFTHGYLGYAFWLFVSMVIAHFIIGVLVFAGTFVIAQEVVIEDESKEEEESEGEEELEIVSDDTDTNDESVRLDPDLTWLQKKQEIAARRKRRRERSRRRAEIAMKHTQYEERRRARLLRRKQKAQAEQKSDAAEKSAQSDGEAAGKKKKKKKKRKRSSKQRSPDDPKTSITVDSAASTLTTDGQSDLDHKLREALAQEPEQLVIDGFDGTKSNRSSRQSALSDESDRPRKYRSKSNGKKKKKKKHHSKKRKKSSV